MNADLSGWWGESRWRSAALLLGPLLMFITLGGLVALHLGDAIGSGGQVIAPHIAVVASMVALLYGVALFTASASARTARAIVLGASIVFSTVIVVFYALTLASIVLMKELLTRQLVAGYVSDLPALVAALPISPVVVVVGFAAIVLAGISVGVVAARCLNASAVVIAGVARHRWAGLIARVLLYGAAIHLLVGFSVPLGWHVFNHELVMSSWHNVRIGSAERYGHRDPLVDAAERRVRESYPATPTGSRANVILIYVDALRADVTQPYGAQRRNMPFVTSLVEAGQLAQVDLALAACPATLCGLGAMLQSRPLPLQHTQNFSLPALLARQGYRTAYVLSSNHQDFMELRQYYEPADFYVDGKDLSASRQTDDYLVLDGLSKLGPWDGRPTFLMVGLVSTHLSGTRDDHNRVFTPDRISLLAPREDYRTAYRNNYDNGVVQADDVLRRIWDWLHSNRYLDHAVVVLTSDHGEFLGERGKFSHGQSLYQPELHIPLWMSPALTNEKPARFARQIDIAPTIVDGLGLPVPSTWGGRSVHLLNEGEHWSEHYLPSSTDTVAIVRRSPSRTLKFLWTRSINEEAVFDLKADPQELHDLKASISAAELDEFRKRARAALPNR